MTPDPFELLLFSTDPVLVREAVCAGIDGVIVDWEQRGKPLRQAGADTEINYDTPADLARVRRATTARVVCRVDGICDRTEEEIETAVGEGADEILVPMVRARREIEGVIELVDGRCGVAMLVETVTAVARIESFAGLPLSRVYMGLNDLAIERGTSNIFGAVADGTVECVRRAVRVPFGFGGLTLPDLGDPIPCRLLMGEMARLDCQFSFLRRSFHRDRCGRSLQDVVGRIRTGLAESRARQAAAIVRDRAALESAIAAWDLDRAASR